MLIKPETLLLFRRRGDLQHLQTANFDCVTALVRLVSRDRTQSGMQKRTDMMREILQNADKDANVIEGMSE